MPLSEAEQVRWPWGGEPLGSAFLNKRLSIGQLFWAVRSANDPKLRAAARTFLAHQLQLPRKSVAVERNRPEVIAGSDYLESMERWSFGEVFFIIGLVAGALMTYLFVVIQEGFKGNLTIPIVIFILGVLTLGLLSVRKQVKNSYQEYKNFRSGREGEDAVADWIISALDSNWTIFRNLLLPDRKGDIDMVLVGPGGVWVVEVKNYSLATHAGASVVPGTSKDQRASLEAQVKNNARNLQEVLERKGVSIPFVHPAIAFPGFKPADFSSDNVVTWYATDIEDKLTQLSFEHVLDEARRKQVVEVLKRLSTK